MLLNLIKFAETTEPSATPTVDPSASTEAVEATSEALVSWESVLEKVVDWATTTGIKLIIALLLLIVSFKLINFFTKRLYNKMKRKGSDETITRVLRSFLRIFLKVIVLICLIGYVGIETASLSALVASLGVGISLAVQGTLANFAGGVIIIIMRPFRIGDFITSNGQSGTVEDIKLFYTIVVTSDNKVVSIPNGILANNVIVNASTKDSRRVDLTISVGYESNLDLVKNLIRKVAATQDLIYKDPALFVEIGVYNNSSIDILVRAWCKNGDYWTVNFYLLENIYKELEANGIEIPYNKLDVTIVNKD